VLSLYLGIVVGFALLFTLGDAGLSEYRELRSYKQSLEDNIAELEQIHWHLQEELRSLATDPEKVRLLARELGYYGRDDGIVRVEGRPPRSSFYRVGRILEGMPARKSSGVRFKVIGLMVPVVFYLLISMIRRWHRRGHKAGSS